MLLLHLSLEIQNHVLDSTIAFVLWASDETFLRSEMHSLWLSTIVIFRLYLSDLIKSNWREIRLSYVSRRYTFSKILQSTCYNLFDSNFSRSIVCWDPPGIWHKCQVSNHKFLGWLSICHIFYFKCFVHCGDFGAAKRNFRFQFLLWKYFCFCQMVYVVALLKSHIFLNCNDLSGHMR